MGIKVLNIDDIEHFKGYVDFKERLHRAVVGRKACVVRIDMHSRDWVFKDYVPEILNELFGMEVTEINKYMAKPYIEFQCEKRVHHVHQ